MAAYIKITVRTVKSVPFAGATHGTVLPARKSAITSRLPYFYAINLARKAVLFGNQQFQK